MSRQRLLLALSVALLGCGPSSVVQEEGPSEGAASGAPATEGSGAEPARSEHRIVSLGGSVTEIVCALDHCGEIVGRDMTSTYPASLADLPDVGYFRKVGAEGILALEPTLVLASSHAGPPTTIEQLRNAGVTVEIIPDEPGLDELHAKIDAVADALDADGAPLRARIDAEVKAAQGTVGEVAPKVLVLYARGAGAAYVMGSATAGDAMVTLAGGVNALAFEGSAPVSAEAIVAAQPEVVVIPKGSLASVGGEDGLFALPGLSGTPAATNRRVIALDDLALMSFGPRTGEVVGELAAALHP